MKPPSEATYSNPALEAFQERTTWTDDGWEPVDDILPLVKYAEYLPTDAAIQTLCEYSPLLEIGAGTGYWASVVADAGGDIIATDPTPGDTEWVDIIDANHTIVAEYPERDILLCHPPSMAWVEALLDLLDSSQHLVLVAEWWPGHDATEHFFDILTDEWQLVETFPVYNWQATDAHGYVFEYVDTTANRFAGGTHRLQEALALEVAYWYDSRPPDGFK